MHTIFPTIRTINIRDLNSTTIGIEDTFGSN
jgi:hypothetical protein